VYLAGRSQRSPSREEQEILQDEDMAVSETLIPWIELADKSVWKDMSPGEIKRQEVMHELFHTEKTHLKKLKTIYYVFYVPLQLSRLVTAEKVEQLFPKLTKIIEIHGYVVQGMRDRWTECYQQGETPGCLTSIGDIMLSLFDSQLGDALIEACSEFVSNQTASLEFIKTMRSKSKEFDRLIQRCEANPLCSRLQISELMSVVMTRLTRYPLLLEKLLKYTDENDPDYGDVESALEASRDALAEVNVHMTLAENQQFLKEIQRKLDTSPLEKGSLQLEEIKNFSLIAEGRDLVYDGHLGWKTVKNRTTNTYAVLLSDMLVLLEHNEDKDRYILKPRPDPSIKSDMYRSPIITFRDFLVRDVATDSKAFFVLSTSSGGPQMHELVAHSMSERETWIMKLKETANSWKYAQKGASAGQRVLLDRRHRYSTPEKLIEPANVSDSEKDSLDMEHETADQIQERLRQRTDFIASSLERKAALLQRLQETCGDKSDQSEVNNSTQPERKDSVEEASLGMRHRILSCLDQGDVVTGFVNQLVYYEETLEKDEKDAKIHQKNLLVLQDLLSATAALNRRLGKLLELEMPDDLSLSLPE
jgi:Rho guanine nucleotide exchange factor 11